MFLLVGGDSSAVIAHLDVYPVWLAMDADVNCHVPLCVFHGILQQVAEDVADVHLVCPHRHRVFVRLETDGDALPLGFLYQRTDEGVEVEHGEVERDLLEVSVGHISQFREIGGQVVQFGLCITDHFLP